MNKYLCRLEIAQKHEDGIVLLGCGFQASKIISIIVKNNKYDPLRWRLSSLLKIWP